MSTTTVMTREAKQCASCRQILLYDMFYKNRTRKDGYQHTCKDCMRNYNKTDYYRERQYRYNKRNPIKKQAHQAVQQAKSKGELIPSPCEVCKSDTSIHAHHDDYSKPLDVRWLCPTHHTARHKELEHA